MNCQIPILFHQNNQTKQNKAKQMKTITKQRSLSEQKDGEKPMRKKVIITAPNFQHAKFHVAGLTRLVVCRFSEVARRAIIEAQMKGSTETSKKKKMKADPDVLFKAARYYSSKGWEGFNATAVRNGMISACKLTDMKMSIAKLCIFAVEDGYDKFEPQFNIIRIYGDPVMQQDHVRNRKTGGYTVATRAAYHDWKAIIKVRWDADRFTDRDITNLMARFGLQIGIGVGRHDSKDSNGMGWGTFEIVKGEVE
jgi:hypothetical protein